MFSNKYAQIWVETVVYTLIALVMIGTVIGIVKPKIEESKDRAIIDQSIDLISALDSVFFEVKSAPGNQRILELGVTDGTLFIDGENDRIVFELESRFKYSEPGENVEDGASGVIVRTEELGKYNNVTLTKYYSENYNITYSRADELKALTKSPTPYKITILNLGQMQFLDPSSSCTTANVEVQCVNPLYLNGYDKYCVGGKCRYLSDKITVNLEVG